MSKSLVLLGGGGHAAVLAEMLERLQLPVQGFSELHAPSVDSRLSHLKFLGDDDNILSAFTPDKTALVNGLGSTGKINKRANLFKHFIAKEYGFIDLIHPAAYLSPSATHGQGVQMLAGAIVNTGTRLGENVLINSRGLVEHHCIVGDHSHIASGAVVCGDCRIGQSVHIGAGAVINQGITIGDGAIIASGAVVITDVPADQLMAGVPAHVKVRSK